MQNYGARVATLDDELTELRKRIIKVHARIGVVEDEIEEVQHALRDLDLPSPADAAGVERQDRDQTRAWLRQEKLRLGSRENMIRQENAQLVQLQLRLFETRLQVQAHAGESRRSPARKAVIRGIRSFSCSCRPIARHRAWRGRQNPTRRARRP